MSSHYFSEYSEYRLPLINHITPYISYYTLLAVSPDCPQKTIRNNIRKLRTLLRSPLNASSEIKQQWTAFDIVCRPFTNPTLRSKYDKVHHLADYQPNTNLLVNVYVIT